MNFNSIPTFHIDNEPHFDSQTAVESNSSRHATKKNNLEKNQNQKTIPYDFSRVVLDKIQGIPDSDYINASYVDVIIARRNYFLASWNHHSSKIIFQSLLKPNAYIVTQGPTEETVSDFWRMVWQENVSCK